MQCRVCKNTNAHSFFEATEMMFGYRDIFRYFQCEKCNCLQIEKFPSDLSKYYPGIYHSYQSVSESNLIRRHIRNLRNKYATFNTGLIGKFFYNRYPNPEFRCLSKIRLKKDSYILDIGCGTGSILCSLSILGFKNLFGADPFIAEDIEYFRGPKIFKKTIYAVQDKWDLIMFHHSFEHIHDPIETLKKVYSLLKPNGICLIRIPTVSSYAWKHYGIYWVQLDAPRHFFLHSLESMKLLAKKCNLDLYNIIYDSTALQFWGSEQYKKGIPYRDKRSYLENRSESIFSKSKIADYENRAKELNAKNQGDQAAFYLRKI